MCTYLLSLALIFSYIGSTNKTLSEIMICQIRLNINFSPFATYNALTKVSFVVSTTKRLRALIEQALNIKNAYENHLKGDTERVSLEYTLSVCLSLFAQNAKFGEFDLTELSD